MAAVVHQKKEEEEEGPVPGAQYTISCVKYALQPTAAERVAVWCAAPPSINKRPDASTANFKVPCYGRAVPDGVSIGQDRAFVSCHSLEDARTALEVVWCRVFDITGVRLPAPVFAAVVTSRLRYHTGHVIRIEDFARVTRAKYKPTVSTQLQMTVDGAVVAVSPSGFINVMATRSESHAHSVLQTVLQRVTPFFAQPVTKAEATEAAEKRRADDPNSKRYMACDYCLGLVAYCDCRRAAAEAGGIKAAPVSPSAPEA